jgi:hypothetical protein
MAKRPINILEKHGTEAFTMPPGAIAQAAIEDVKRYFRNKARARDEKDAGARDDWEQYAFARVHVHQALNEIECAKALLKLALKFRKVGKHSSKPMTRYIYSRPKLIRAAIKEVDARARSKHDDSVSR